MSIIKDHGTTILAAASVVTLIHATPKLVDSVANHDSVIKDTAPVIVPGSQSSTVNAPQ